MAGLPPPAGGIGGIGVPLAPAPAAAAAAIPWFDTSIDAVPANSMPTIHQIIHRVIDLTFYGEDKTGIAIDAQMGATLGQAPALAINTSNFITRNNVNVEGTNINWSQSAGVLGINGSVALPAPAPLVQIQQFTGIPAAGAVGAGSIWTFNDGIRAGLVHFLNRAFNNQSFIARPSTNPANMRTRLKRIYSDALRIYNSIGPVIASLPVNSQAIQSLYITCKENLLPVFFSLIVPTPPVGNGVPEIAYKSMLDAIAGQQHTASLIASSSFNPLGAPQRYNDGLNKYLKYKQKYLALKNEK